MERLTMKRRSPCKGYELKEDSIISEYVALNKLGKLEDLEKQIGMPLEWLYGQYQLYQQAFYLACWTLAECDNKGCCDEMEASDEWKEIIMIEANRKLEEIKNENA